MSLSKALKMVSRVSLLRYMVSVTTDWGPVFSSFYNRTQASCLKNSYGLCPHNVAHNIILNCQKPSNAFILNLLVKMLLLLLLFQLHSESRAFREEKLTLSNLFLSINSSKVDMYSTRPLAVSLASLGCRVRHGRFICITFPITLHQSDNLMQPVSRKLQSVKQYLILIGINQIKITFDKFGSFNSSYKFAGNFTKAAEPCLDLYHLLISIWQLQLSVLGPLLLRRDKWFYITCTIQSTTCEAAHQIQMNHWV